MTKEEQFELVRKNILALSWSMDDAPYHGVHQQTIQGIKFAIKKILEDTGLTIPSLLEECENKKWFEWRGTDESSKLG